MTSRRGFLAGVGALVTAPTLSWAAVGKPIALSGARLPDGSDVLAGIDSTGALTFKVPLPTRAHAGAAHPDYAEAVVIARRPGTFAKVLDCASGRVIQDLQTPQGHHFYGHAAFSTDGGYLFTTENHMASGEGRIGVWDRSLGYRRIDSFSSGGIGPHEILRLPSGDLAVANGGIRTHPDTGREKLNLETMRPNLAILSSGGSVRTVADRPLAQHQNSLRHIAVAPDGTIVCGFQWQGDPFDAPPLLSLYDESSGLQTVTLDDDLHRGLNAYIGSVCAIGPDSFAASSPRGGRVIMFDASGRVTAHHRALDVCGLMPSSGGDLLASDGNGRVHAVTKTDLHAVAHHAAAFDNHMIAVSPSSPV